MEAVDGLEHRDMESVKPLGDIPRLLRFYVFVIFVMVAHLVFYVVRAYIGWRNFSSTTHIGITESLESAMSIAYCGMMASHSAMFNEKHFDNCFGYIEETAASDGTLPSPPRVKRSFLSIAMSYLQTNLYLLVLVLAVMGVNIILTKHSDFHPSSTSLVCSILYFLGGVLYTYQVFNIRTNVIILMACVYNMTMVINPGYLGALIMIFPDFHSKIFLRHRKISRAVTGASDISPLTGASTGDWTDIMMPDGWSREASSRWLFANNAPGIAYVYDD